MIHDILKDFLSEPTTLVIWTGLVVASALTLLADFQRNNARLGALMKWVWALTVLYSGPIGLAIYGYSGRAQISRDSLPRRGFRSVAHCYSGCGAGEIVGVFIAAGLLGLGNLWIAGITFLLAYVAGFALTMGPLLEEGVSFNDALRDSFVSESASITVMELVAIGIDLSLAVGTTMNDVLFWSSLVFSLSCGLFAAWPVNLLLIRYGIKEGMHDPREMAQP